VNARHALVDVLAVVVLGLLVVSGLDDGFADHGYLVVVAVALAVTTSWALLCLAQGWSSAVCLLGLLLAYPLVAAWTVYRNLDWLGLPSPDALGRTVTGAITGPAEFLTTIPPVDVAGDVLGIPFVLAYVGGGLSILLALRTSRPLLPVVPHVLVLAVVVLLGTSDPTELLVRAVAIGVVTAVWVVLREARHEDSLHATRGRVVRVVTAAVLVAVTGAVVGSGVPDQSAERVVLRGRVGSGQDVSQLDNPLSTFRKYTEQLPGTTDNLHDARLLVVRGLPRGAMLRIVALDQYDGSTWSPGNRTVPGDDAALFQRIASQVGAPRPGQPVRVGVEVRKAWSSSWLPLAGQLTGITFDYLDGRAQRSDVRYDVATQTGMVVGGLAARDDYTFTAVLPDTTLRRTMAPWGRGRPLLSTGSFLDVHLEPWRTSGLTPVRQVYSLARYLRTNGRYSNGASVAERRYLPGHGQVRLGDGFIGARSIVGDDEQYAAFMALAANRLGVPARVVVGARVERDGDVRGRDVQAWVELRVSDGTWRVLPTSTFMSYKPPKRSDVRQSPASYVQTTVPRADDVDPPPAQQPPQQPTPPAQRLDHGASPWPLLGGMLLLLLLAAVPVAKVVRRWWRGRHGSPTRRIAAGWQELLDLATDQGAEVPHGRARTVQARRLGLPLELARRADVLVFAREDPTEEQVHALLHEVGSSLRERRRSQPPLRRVLTRWNPRSLVPRDGLRIRPRAVLPRRRGARPAPRGRADDHVRAA
jgi:hypothetical protein